MITSKTKLLVLAASVLALASGAQAQMLPANITVGGFAAASYTHNSATYPVTGDRLDIDNALLKFTGDYKPVTGVVSLFYVPASVPDEVHLLDVYATYDMGGGWAITGGRFLSFMGYESFFTENNPEISFGYLNGVIAGYEDGVRVAYTDKDWNAGVALVDSALNSPSAFKGDTELKKGYGAEFYFSYTGIKDNTLWVGLSYDSTNGAVSHQETFDIWDQYQLAKEYYVAGEIAIHNGGAGTAVPDATSWLLLLNYTFSDQVSSAFRVGGDVNNGPVADDIKYTFAPTYTINKNFSVRGELSYTVVNGPAKETTFIGVQGVFRF